MDRRRFLQMCGGGMVATATMAEVGFFAEFMAWVKRMPVWSIPKKTAIIGSYAEFTSLSDMALSTAISDMAVIYYDRKAIEALKNNTKFEAVYERGHVLPDHRKKSIQMFHYALDPAGIDA